MRIFRTNYSVCSECQVHFEPVAGADARWGNLCKIHRETVKARDLQRDAVVVWATLNWEKLVPQMEKDNEEKKKSCIQSQQDLYLATLKAQQGLSSLGGGIWRGPGELTR